MSSAQYKWLAAINAHANETSTRANVRRLGFVRVFAGETQSKVSQTRREIVLHSSKQDDISVVRLPCYPGYMRQCQQHSQLPLHWAHMHTSENTVFGEFSNQITFVFTSFAFASAYSGQPSEASPTPTELFSWACV